MSRAEFVFFTAFACSIAQTIYIAIIRKQSPELSRGSRYIISILVVGWNLAVASGATWIALHIH